MIDFSSITPTFYFSNKGGPLVQLVRLNLINDCKSVAAALRICVPGLSEQRLVLSIPAGESQHNVYIPEITHQCVAGFSLDVDGVQHASREIVLQVQRKWTVHVVQMSHHDPGYTDLPSLVLREHDGFLDAAINIAEQTEFFPDDAKFRIVIEQAWSIDHFMKHMPNDRVAKIIDLMRTGRFELTALFGNMTTELCGHETLARAAYHAFEIKRKYGVPIISAEHNDITGISWGLSRVLTDAGIQFFCPGIPLYYDWGKDFRMQSFWDQKQIFGHEGPGAFWWESPARKKVLFWCNNSGCGGSSYSTLPDLEEKLKLYEQQGYPWPVLRWPVSGGARDNSPYIEGYAHTIKAWNEKWAYPRLVSSTNTMFYNDLMLQDLSNLPTWRGELPGQDYPGGSTSTAAATATNRNAHSTLLSAEKLASAALLHTDYSYPQDILSEGYEETLWFDEHAWGFHFPCGPAMRASEFEKGLHAYRAEALAHGVCNKAMSNIADSLTLGEGYHLVVFNTTSWSCTAPVRASLRETDNSGSEMRLVPPAKDERGIGYLRGYVLGHRFHTVLPQEFMDGNFMLVNMETGRAVDYQMEEIDSAMEPLPYSAERLGIGSGSKRVGLFEEPIGVKRDLCFIAEDVPAMGYRAYRLVPADRMQHKTVAKAGSGTIENEYYRVAVDESGSVASIYDKQMAQELVDSTCMHGFFKMLVREGNAAEPVLDECMAIDIEKGAVLSKIRMISRVYGHPAIQKNIMLYSGIQQIFLDLKVLKDSTPLLNAHISFPFAIIKPEFRYEGVLSVMNPIRDYLPGSYSDTIAVQNWVKVQDNDHSILWSSPDAPIASLGLLWPGYVSPAHRCVLDERAVHAPQKEEDLSRGWVYSQLFNNNFGTNFSVSQCGEALFRYVLTSEKAGMPDAAAARFGWQAVSPLIQIMTDRVYRSDHLLSPSGSFLEIDNANVAIVNLKKAENGRSFIVRLWNMSDCEEKAELAFPEKEIAEATCTDLCEEDIEPALCTENRVQVHIAPRDMVVLRIVIR